MGLFYSFSPQDKTSVVYDYKTIDTAKDFIVSLEYACYGGTTNGAEGFSLFFVDCRNLTSDGKTGGPGPALGATSIIGVSGAAGFVYFPGVVNASLIIGFDITGNFGSDFWPLDGYDTPAPNTLFCFVLKIF